MCVWGSLIIHFNYQEQKQNTVTWRWRGVILQKSLSPWQCVWVWAVQTPVACINLCMANLCPGPRMSHRFHWLRPRTLFVIQHEAAEVWDCLWNALQCSAPSKQTHNNFQTSMQNLKCICSIVNVTFFSCQSSLWWRAQIAESSLKAEAKQNGALSFADTCCHFSCLLPCMLGFPPPTRLAHWLLLMNGCVVMCAQVISCSFY